MELKKLENIPQWWQLAIVSAGANASEANLDPEVAEYFTLCDYLVMTGKMTEDQRKQALGANGPLNPGEVNVLAKYMKVAISTIEKYKDQCPEDQQPDVWLPRDDD